MQAIICLDTFPSKITELNDLVSRYTPEPVKHSKYNETTVGRKAQCQSTLSSSINWDLNSVSDYGNHRH